jgi:hypothetical protein
MEDKIIELLEKIEDSCSTLAITHDAPDVDMIRDWCEEYHQLKIKPS